MLNYSIITLFVLIFINNSIFSQQQDSESALFKILKKKSLNVSVGAAYEPYFIANPKPDYPGFEVEIAEKYAEFLGVKLDKVIPLNNFGEHARAVNDGTVDVSLGNSSALGRMKLVYFSDPYIIISIGGLVNKSILPPEQEGDIVLNKAFRSVLDLKSITRISFGAKDKTSNLDFVKDTFGQFPVTPFENDEIALEALINNNITAYIADNLYIEGLLQKNNNLRARFLPLTTPIMEKQVSFCFKKYDIQLESNLNLFVRDLKRTGTINALREKYFNSNKWVKDR
ncbi:MAG: ABC transporter substrate-binding protein [Spirochaetia bacterium]|nr:ABC transporter substrate-binding protein [Spirochaetia bacterium]